jgi:hypothetical protein
VAQQMLNLAEIIVCTIDTAMDVMQVCC